MATRENQGLQATIIVLVILVIGLGVGLLLMNNAKKTAQARAASAEQQSSKDQGALATAQEEANTYKEWMGFQSSDSKAAIVPLVKEDQDRFMANIEEESRKYRTALSAIFEEREKLAASESKAKQDVKDMQDRLLAIESQKEAQVKEAQKALETAKQDAAAEKLKFDQFRATMEAEKDKLAKDMSELQVKHDESVAKLTAEKTDLNRTIAKMDRSIDLLRAGLPEVDQFAQPADGRITWVNQKYGKAWINIGSADGLRPQVTFSVAAAEGEADAEAAAKKGAIEVVRVTAPHMAEVKITSDEPTNPLLPGDRIYSQVWDRGRQVGFAIAGFIDMDGDKRSDLQKLKNIITTSNGRIDAAPDDKGVKQGEITINTRYLILGEYPSDASQTDPRMVTWNDLSAEAERLGVETISIDEFLKLMGWQADNRSVVMGAGSRAEDFPAEPRTQEMPRKTRQPEGVFKKRLPGVSY
jgi:hypothetical protein